MNPLIIAAVAYAINASYLSALGVEVPEPWTSLTEEQRQNYASDVIFLIENPESGPAEQHDNWLADKQADGWVYGEEKDDEKKTHPAMIAYDDLPVETRIKDAIFHAAVTQLSMIEPPKVEVSEAAVIAKPAAAPRSFKPIRYIGRRDKYIENMYGTGIEFTRDTVEMVPADKAVLLLRHPDQYEAAGDVVEEINVEPQSDNPNDPDANKTQGKQDDNDTEAELQEARDLVANMELDAVKSFIKTNYQQSVHHNIGLDKARAKAVQLIDQYGIK